MQSRSGLDIQDVSVGTGDVVERGSRVSIARRGWLNRGDEFGSGAVSFRVGRREAIAGLDYGVVGMRAGGVRRLRVSPHLAYGDQGVPSVPARAVLDIEVTVVAVEPC